MKNQPVMYKGERVLTTKVLANFMEVSTNTITSITNGCYKKNKILQDKLIDTLNEGTDYFDIKGEERLQFVDNNRGSLVNVTVRGGKFRVFTKQGTAKMARNLKRLNLYYDIIYGYFSKSDLTEYYLKYRNYFISDNIKKESAKMYKDNTQYRLDQIEKSIGILTAKVEEQREDTNKRMTILEEMIDRLLEDRMKGIAVK